jgi:hypothetical protein
MNQLLFSVAALLMTTAAISAAHRQSMQVPGKSKNDKLEKQPAIQLRKL